MATDTAVEERTLRLSHRQVLIVFSGLMLGMLLAALDQTIVSTALPTIVSDLHGVNHLEWVVTAYLLTSTASTPLYGKISDLYGRKRIFQVAIVVFLVGSALSGLSRNMNELIAFRAVQGLGAGGLITLAITIIADIVSPRERGRYQGYFGAVFAVSSVGGPLLGGFFTEHLSWRWIFYVNLPIGIVALIVTSAVLNLPFRRRQHAVDYLGAAVMVAGVCALLLVTVWGGEQDNGGYAWGSPVIIALILGGVALLAVFLFWERVVREPILPPYLFRTSVFSVCGSISFVMGFAMFGAIVFLPYYLQVSRGASPTASGLEMLPIMVGVLGASIGAGRLVSKYGRYKYLVVGGTGLLTLGMWLFSYLTLTTPWTALIPFMLVLGVGLGVCMQQLVVATQNAVPVQDMGTATSSITFFRSMGGAFGTSLFGAILVARLNYWIPRLLPVGAQRLNAHSVTAAPAALHALPPPIRHGIASAFVHALHPLFVVGTPIAGLGFLLAWLLREIKLRETAGLSRDVDALPGGAVAEGAWSEQRKAEAGSVALPAPTEP